MILRFEIFTADTKRSVEFYKNILRFEHTREDVNDRYHVVKRGSVQIGIGLAEKLKENHYFRPEILEQRKGLGVEIVLEVDDILKEYDEVKKTRYSIESPLVKREWGLIDFRLVDPDGYYLRITSRS